MNWGTRILIIFGAFVSMLFYFLYVASKQNNELVDSNYYQEELEFQKKIDAASRLNLISDRPISRIVEQEILFQLPKKSVIDFSQGSIKFIHHALKSADRNFELKTDTTGIFKMDKSNLPVKGAYKLRIAWTSGLKTYYREEELSL